MTISPLFSPSEPPPSHTHIRERKREFQIKGGKREFDFIPHLLPPTFLSVQFLNGWVACFFFLFCLLSITVRLGTFESSQCAFGVTVPHRISVRGEEDGPVRGTDGPWGGP